MLKIISFIVALYLIATLFLFVKQRSLLYFPMPETNAADAEAVWLESPERRLKLWQLGQGNTALIYFGGNAESIEMNIPEFRQLLPDLTVYLVNYRGYGGSSGEPSEAALLNDALAVYDEFRSVYDRIFVMGRSLGSGIASYLAANRPVERLLLVTPYDSIARVAQSHYPLFPVKWLLKDRFDSYRWAAKINSEVMLLIAEQDQVIPRRYSLDFADAMRLTDPQIVVIPATDHNSIGAHPLYREKLAEFLTPAD